MYRIKTSIRISAASLLTTIFCLFIVQPLHARQVANPPQTTSTGNPFRVAGTVVSRLDGHPLVRTRVTLRDAKAPNKFETLITSDDGRFEFQGVPAGKYDLHGAKQGFIAASYDQHEQFSTAIVTGAGLDTESLVLRMAPAAVIAGKVLDEAGEPVRHALIELYSNDHRNGVDQIRRSGADGTDDQGVYEIAGLSPGTYFLSVSAKPWYAVHPNSQDSSSGDNSADPANLVRALDVAYPVTYYADVTESESATPIPIRGGERLQVDIHLNPVPALHLLFRVPNNGNRGDIFPRLEQPAFDGSAFLQSDIVRTVSPGVVEISGVPAGRYNVHFYGAGSGIQMNGVDLTRNGEEIDTSRGETLGTVKISVQRPSETSSSERLAIGLRPSRGSMFGPLPVDEKGEVEFQQIPAGHYEMALWGGNARYSISRISAEGAQVSGHTLTLPANASAAVSLTLVEGSVKIEGTASSGGKPFAGAMVVLVPKNPENNRDLFRRDQSDLDGTFSLQNVIPGSYTVLAIENGWDLDWSQPAVIAAYLKRGRIIEVGNHSSRAMNLSETVEVQSK